MAEAALTGLFAPLIGLGLGVIAALGVKALLGAFGVTLPPMSLVFEARTVVVALAVGIGVTVISAVIPARRAVRIPPVAALAAQPDDDAQRTRRSRVIIGAAIALVGIVAVIGGLAQPSAELVGIGAVVIFIATGMLVPLIARPLSSMLGGPLVKLAGTPARLGRDNSMRNPRRTAQTAGALMFGITLLAAIGVLGSSSSASTQAQIQAALTANYVITSSSNLSAAVPAIVSRLPQVSDTTALYTGQFAVKGTVLTLTAASPNRLSRTLNLRITAGSGQRAMAAGQLLIDTTSANSDDLHVGSTVPVTFAQTGTTTMPMAESSHQTP
jgi:putative ABC transport system permease protein